MGSKASGKKKGPKGKKARAKAKLERQWGEVAIADDAKHTKRVGKSRILGKQQKSSVRWGDEKKRDFSKSNKQQRRRNDNSGNASSDDSSSDDSENEMSTVNHLLLSIRKSNRKKRKAAEKERSRQIQMDDEDEEISDDDLNMEEDIQSVNEEVSTSEEEDDGDEASLDPDAEDDDDDNSVQNDNDETTIDLFRQRFGRQPLKESELNADPSPIKRISIDASLELQASLPTHGENPLANLMVTDKDPAKKLEHWQKCSKSALEGSRKVLQHQWKRFNNKRSFTVNQAPVYPVLTRYTDLFVTAESIKNRNEMQRIYMLHLLNHVLTSRSRIQRHNRQLREIERAEDEAKQNDDNTEENFRDQGFTRPTVLVLLPTRSTCYKFVQDLYQLSGNELESDNERFEAEYGNADDEESTNEEKERRRKAVLEKKGRAWNELFRDNVNQDDDFKLGISLTPKAAKGKKEKSKSSNVGIKLYSDFYKSDIIVASPLGLKLLITPDEEEKEGDYDYLTSIEICLVEYADVLLMQNWDHVNDILSLLNQEPQNNNKTDFSRVRNYLLEGQAANWRQLIISSNIMDPHLISAFTRFAKSVSGAMKMRRKVDVEDASIGSVLIPIKQVFQKVPAPSFDKQSEARVNYFVKSILPQILRHKQKHTMIYIPSYFDFCSLRNILLKRDISFVSVHEYSRTSEISRGRARFLQGRKPIMLYTGRSNFFHRHAIKGVRHLVFLGLPEHSEFYSEHVNQISTTSDDTDVEAATASVSSCLVLCTRYEALALERIVGSNNCSRMLKSQKSTFMFYS